MEEAGSTATIDEHFRFEMPFNLSQDEIEHYYAALETDEHCGGPDVVSEIIMSGAADLLVYSNGKSSGVFIVRDVIRPDETKELFIWMMAGRKMMNRRNLPIIERFFKSLALSRACVEVSAMMKPEILDRLGGLKKFSSGLVSITMDATK